MCRPQLLLEKLGFVAPPFMALVALAFPDLMQANEPALTSLFSDVASALQLLPLALMVPLFLIADFCIGVSILAHHLWVLFAPLLVARFLWGRARGAK